ncbi:hypothetical protein [Okeania sp. SIO2B3]|nr:hypothetical protein [Okeania sp. SIO2B3]NET42853.1 hypothetical protein [Okeania sp. SIO2B3]
MVNDSNSVVFIKKLINSAFSLILQHSSPLPYFFTFINIGYVDRRI